MCWRGSSPTAWRRRSGSPSSSTIAAAGRRDRRQGGGSSRPRRLHAAVRQHRDARQYPGDLEKRRLRFGQELRRRRQGDGLLPGPRRQPQPSGEVGRGAHRLCQGQPGQAQLRRRRTDQPHQSRGRALQAQGRARFRGRAFQERRGIADLRRRRSVPAHHRQRHRRARADGGRQAAPAGGHQRPPAKRLPRSADHDRGRRPRLCGDELLRRGGAGRHARAGDRAAQRRHQRSAAHGGGAGRAQEARRRAHDREPGRVLRFIAAEMRKWTEIAAIAGIKAD